MSDDKLEDIIFRLDDEKRQLQAELDSANRTLKTLVELRQMNGELRWELSQLQDKYDDLGKEHVEMLNSDKKC
jgi:hypothetical protein